MDDADAAITAGTCILSNLPLYPNPPQKTRNAVNGKRAGAEEEIDAHTSISLQLQYVITLLANTLTHLSALIPVPSNILSHITLPVSHPIQYTHFNRTSSFLLPPAFRTLPAT